MEIPRGMLGATTGVTKGRKYGYNGVTTGKYRGHHWGFVWGRGHREIPRLLNHGLLISNNKMAMLSISLSSVYVSNFANR